MSKIKANVPLAYKQGAKADRMRMMNAFFIYSGYVLYKHHDFTEKRAARVCKQDGRVLRSREA